MKTLVILTSAVIAATCHAGTNELPTTTFNVSDIGGAHRVQIVWPSDLAALPKWNPETESCPLDMREAIGKARHCLASASPAHSNAPLHSVKIERYWETGTWLYNVIFMIPVSKSVHGGRITGESFSVHVGLNGWIPEIQRHPGLWTTMETTTTTNEHGQVNVRTISRIKQGSSEQTPAGDVLKAAPDE